MTTNDFIAASGDRARGMLAELFGEPSPDAVFSAPERVGDDVVISAAAWERAGGFGFGGGGSGADGGGGAAGGGLGKARPVAVIRLTPAGTEVTPVPDLTKIAVTVVIAALGVWRALR